MQLLQLTQRAYTNGALTRKRDQIARAVAARQDAQQRQLGEEEAPSPHKRARLTKEQRKQAVAGTALQSIMVGPAIASSKDPSSNDCFVDLPKDESQVMKDYLRVRNAVYQNWRSHQHLTVRIPCTYVLA